MLCTSLIAWDDVTPEILRGEDRLLALPLLTQPDSRRPTENGPWQARRRAGGGCRRGIRYSIKLYHNILKKSTKWFEI